MWKSAVLKDVDTSPVVKLQPRCLHNAITPIRQSSVEAVVQ